MGSALNWQQDAYTFALIEISRLQRAAECATRDRIASQQAGTAFRGLDTAVKPYTVKVEPTCPAM